MRRVWLVAFALALLAVGALAAPASVAPDAAVLAAPQVDDLDTALLQIDSQAQTQTGNVAALESQLAAAMAAQQALQAQVDQHATAQVASAAEHADAAKAEGEAAADSESETVSQLEAEFEAQAAAEVDSESGVAAKAETEAETETEAEAETETETEAETEAEAETENKAEAETEAESEAENKAEAAKDDVVSGHVVDTASGTPAPAASEAAPKVTEARFAQRILGHKPVFTSKQIKVTRAVPGGPADVVKLPNGKKLFKSWVVNPNLRVERDVKKPAPRHSRERVMTEEERNHFSEHASVKPVRPRLSQIRREFLRLNPEQRAARLRSRNLSPTAAFLRAFRKGGFPQLEADVLSKAGASVTRHSVTQHLTIKHHSPSVRQRAEVAALRAASCTLRRINSKRREYKKALRALRLARNEVQTQIHRHHVLKAVEARKIAARASRRAAWSALLQHDRLRRELLRTISRALRKGHLTGEARRQAIAALIKQNLSPKERKRLHAFIKSQLTRSHRHRARGQRAQKRKAKKAAKKAAKVAKKAAAKTAVSAKDQKAIDTLVKRIQAVAKGAKKPVVGAAASSSPSASPRASTNRITPVRFAQAEAEAETETEAESEADVEAEVEAEAQTEAEAESEANAEAAAELQAAEALAAEAENEAVSELSVETEADQADNQTEAQVAALTDSSDEFLNQHGL